ncbi:MAG: hypothetical protein ACFE9N_13690, partial [Promethearchaeota archaeon]
SKKKELIKINREKLFPKVILVLVMSLFFITIITIVTPAKANESSHIFILANGDDMDIPGANTLILGKIEFSGESSSQLYFQTKIYDELGNKIYTIEGKLKYGAVLFVPEYYCDVRNVLWVNLWLVMGEGMIKTTDADLTIEYRGETITLPNTKGKYVTATIMMLVSPKGEILLPNGGNLELGGWTFAGIPGFGGVTSLKLYKEI